MNIPKKKRRTRRKRKLHSNEYVARLHIVYNKKWKEISSWTDTYPRYKLVLSKNDIFKTNNRNLLKLYMDLMGLEFSDRSLSSSVFFVKMFRLKNKNLDN